MVRFGRIKDTLGSAKAALSASLGRIFQTTMSSSSSAPASSSSHHKAALIFLHGLGDQGSSWQMQLAPMLPSHIKCICPTAPNQPVTLNFGMRMSSWFDLRSLKPDDPEDEDGIKAAGKQIHQLIEEQEKQGIPHDRIILGGFSQGGALSLYAALTYPKKLAGVIALSCWLPLHRQFPSIASEPGKQIPIIQCHGDSDCIVPKQWALESKRILSTFIEADQYTFKIYDGLAHSSSTQELRDVLEFIRKHLPN